MLLTTGAITMAKECHRHGTVMPVALFCQRCGRGVTLLSVLRFVADVIFFRLVYWDILNITLSL